MLIRSCRALEVARVPHSNAFSPIKPRRFANFSSSSSAAAARPAHPAAQPVKRPSKRLRRLALASAFGVGLFAGDHLFNADALQRTLRTGFYGLLIAIDFKLNFNPEKSERIDELHERVARRIHYVCTKNNTLYVKLAQSLAVQAAILPAPYRKAFAEVFDGAPSVSYDQVVKVFKDEFGVHPDEAFESFEHEPIASASIAQVHKARLKRKPGQDEPWADDEGWVAVKVRKPDVPKQIEWDLFAYRTLLSVYEKVFDLPVAFVSRYVSEQMRKEVDLYHEATNAKRAAEHLANEPALTDKVSIPRVYWEWTGKSIMTAELVRGGAVKLTDRAALEKMSLSIKEAMDIATALFAAQTFKFGFVHSDPHPGNILVRPHPKDPSRPEVVLIDHGLYIELPEKFRHEYCLLWRSLFVGDTKTIEDIAQKWGIGAQNSEMFASMTLLRPHRLRKRMAGNGAEDSQKGEQPSKEPTAYDAQVGLKEKLKSMLENQQLIPRQLIFLTRSMRMMQANNQALGSPSNRINAMAHWAVEGLQLSQGTSTDLVRSIGLSSFVKEKLQLVVFKLTLFVIDVGFLLTRARQWFLETLGRKADQGFEDVLQRQVTEMAKKEFGVDIDDSAFAG